MPDADQLIPLVYQQTTPRSATFFSRLRNKPLQTIKNIPLTLVGAFSGVMYWSSSFQAASFGGKPLQYCAAMGGSITNGIFNIESFLNLFELPNVRKMPLKYLSALVIAFFCVLPNFLMNIEDEDGSQIDNSYIALQGIIGLLNVIVNVVGTIELIDSISDCYNKTPSRKKLEKLKLTIEIFYRLKPEEQNEAKFRDILLRQFEPISYSKKITYLSIKSIIGVVAAPQLFAYTLISYFDVKALAKNKFGLKNTQSNVLGSLAALGNAIPGAGFSIKGFNSICERLISAEKPSLLALLFILPASFSGFTTHKAMADSLKQLSYSDNFAEVLKWSANLGAAFIYNWPQLISLADRINKKNNNLPDNMQIFMQNIKNSIESLNLNPDEMSVTRLINDLSSNECQDNNDNYRERNASYSSI